MKARFLVGRASEEGAYSLDYKSTLTRR